MKFSIFLSLLIAALMMFQSCQDKQRKGHYEERVKFITESSFPIHAELDFIQTATDMGDALELAVIDTILVKSDLRDSLILHLYGLKSKKLIKKLIIRGTGKNECLSISAILPTNNSKEFWCADITLRKLIKINITQALADQVYTPEKEVILNNKMKGIYNLSWINDSLFVATSYMEASKRLIYFNDKSQIVKKAGELPEYDTEKWPKENRDSIFSIQAMVYTANVKQNLKKDLSVVACKTTDRIEFFDSKRSIRRLQGPDRFEPLYVFRNEGTSYTPIDDKNTKFAYMRLATSDSSVYCLYSGKDHMMTCATKIFVFDWYGNPKESYTIKNNYCIMAIEEHDGKRILWSIDPSNGKLIYANL